jgi:hypothetical protein
MKTRNPLFLVYRTSVAGFPIVCQEGKRTIDLSVCGERYAISDLHCEKSDSLVSDISAGDQNIEKLTYITPYSEKRLYYIEYLSFCPVV